MLGQHRPERPAGVGIRLIGMWYNSNIKPQIVGR